jgi:hypothetical protein
VPKGLIVNPAKRDDAVTQLQAKVAELVNKAVLAHAHVPTWSCGASPSSPSRSRASGASASDLKRFLESLQAFNTAGKLKSFPHDVATIQAQRPGLALVREVEELGELVQQVGPTTSYLGKAEAVLQPAIRGWIRCGSDAAS